MSRLKAEVVFELNNVGSSKIPIGFLLERAHAVTNFGKPSKPLPLARLVLSAFVNSFKTRAKFDFKNNKILFLKNKDKFHFNSLIDPLSNHYKHKSVSLIADQIEKKYKQSHYRGTILDLCRSIGVVLFNKNRIRRIYEKASYKVNHKMVFNELFIMLLAYYNWKRYLINSDVKLIVVDTDHSYMSIALLCAAREFNISSATLQHGSIDHTLSYYPLIADEMWCWGQNAENVLTKAGLDPKKIKLVGNPIAQGKIEKQKRTYKIGLALSGDHLEELERKMIEAIINHDTLKEFTFILKIRPSKEPEAWMKALPRTEVFKTNSKSNANSLFFRSIDIMVLTISSIGYEAMDSGVPLWVYRINAEGSYMDVVMIEKGNCPDVSKPEELTKHANSLVDEGEYYLNRLYMEQEDFLRKEYYSASGKEAVKNIINTIDQKLLSLGAH